MLRKHHGATGQSTRGGKRRQGCTGNGERSGRELVACSRMHRGLKKGNRKRSLIYDRKERRLFSNSCMAREKSEQKRHVMHILCTCLGEKEKGTIGPDSATKLFTARHIEKC